MELSVIVPTHNPHPGRLRRTLAGLRGQTLPASRWETVVIDNASSAALEESALTAEGPANLRLIREEKLGLTSARRRGFAEAKGALAVLADDDNVLASDYLERVAALFAAHPGVGALGGKVLPEFEREPAPWEREFLPLLTLRDLGPAPVISRGLRPDGGAGNAYPAAAAPVGAGMAIRLEPARLWSAQAGSAVSDRRGGELTSSGDNDIVLTLMQHGWEVAYFPELSLTHLIPAGRLDPDYLARLNRGIQKSWMQVLSRHEANPWPRLSPLTVPLRQIKAWFAYRAWSGPAGRIRWQGACGHFEGRTGAVPLFRACAPH